MVDIYVSKMLQKTVPLIAFLALILCSCGAKRDYSNMSARQMFTEASEIAAKGSRSRDNALEMLKELQLRHSFSPYASMASLKTADIYFSDGRYRSAGDQYKKFIAENPGHEKREWAMYQLSESFHRLKKSHKRDQQPCKQAIYWYRSFLSYYPHSEMKDEALQKINDCAEILAKSELEIGKFYLKRKHYKAARRRFAYLADNFPKTEAALESEYFLAKIPPEAENNTGAE